MSEQSSTMLLVRDTFILGSLVAPVSALQEDF